MQVANDSSKVVICEMLEQAGIRDDIVSVEEISTGLLNSVYLVWLSSERGIILRIRQFNHDEYGQEFAAERFAYHLLPDSSVPYPALLYVSPSGAREGKAFAVFEYCAGDTLDEALGKGQLVGARKLRFLEKLAVAVARIHSVRGPGFGTLTHTLFAATEVAAFWRKLFLAEISRLSEVDESGAHKLARCLDGWIDELVALPLKWRTPRLIHGDLHGRNIIVDANQCPILIDWEASRFRMAPYDFAQIGWLNFRDDRISFNSLLQFYCDAAGLKNAVEQFARATKIFQVFWQLRMALFQLRFPYAESPYFGSARQHMSDAVQGASDEISVCPGVANSLVNFEGVNHD